MAEASNTITLPENGDSAGIARRRLLGAVAAAPVIAATASVAAAAHDDAELQAAWRGFQQTYREFEAACALLPNGGTETDHAPFKRRLDALQARIEAIPALGMAGVALKLRMLFADQVETDAAFRTAIFDEPMSAQLADEMDTSDHVLWRLIQNVEALPAEAVA